MRNLFLALVLLIYLPTGLARGQSQLTSEVLDVKNKLEKDIQQNLHHIISTQLEPNSFFVATSVKAILIPPPKAKNNKPETDALPAGVDLGLISAFEMAESYERELEELKLMKEQVKDPPRYQVTKIEVLVGLDESLGEEYMNTFKTWLQTKVKKDYGPLAVANVNKFTKKVIPKEEPIPEDPYAFKNLIPLIAMALVALAMILLGLFLKSGLNKVATAVKPLQLEPKNEFKVEELPAAKPEEPAAEELLPEPARAETYNVGDQIDQLINKIAFVCMESGPGLADLVGVWIDSGDEGFLKTSLLIDTILTARERIMTQTGTIANLNIPLTEDLAKTYEENLAEAYRAVGDMGQDDKLILLQKIYWDLVSKKTLGLQSLRRPFDFLQSMKKEDLLELLQSQKEDARALAVLYLPKEIKSDVLKQLNSEEQENIITKMLINSQISDKQIWDLDTSIKVATLNQSANPAEKLVNLFPRTVEVLQSLNSLEEIKILRKVASSLENGGQVLKQQYTTLAFIDEWAPEYVRKLTQAATADEIVTLVRVIPEAKSYVLSECADKIKTIVEDDLKLPPPADSSQYNVKLNSLKAKWNKLVLSEQLSMTRVLAKSPRTEVSHAA